MVWGLYTLYGLYYAFTKGTGKAMAAELVPEANRGAAYGLYNASIGVMALPASLNAGALWQRVSSAAPFAFSAIVAFIAFVALWFIPEKIARMRSL